MSRQHVALDLGDGGAVLGLDEQQHVHNPFVGKTYPVGPLCLQRKEPLRCIVCQIQSNANFSQTATLLHRCRCKTSLYFEQINTELVQTYNIALKTSLAQIHAKHLRKVR